MGLQSANKLYLSPSTHFLIFSALLTCALSASSLQVRKGARCILSESESSEVECSLKQLAELGCCSKVWEEAVPCNPGQTQSPNTSICQNDAYGCYRLNGTSKFYIEREPSQTNRPKSDFNECRLKTFVQPNLNSIKLAKRSSLSLLPKTLLGKPCNRQLYEHHKIREMWESYLQCPFDGLLEPNPIDIQTSPLHNIISLSYYHKDIFKSVCLASSEMLECVYDPGKNTTAHCSCLQFVPKKRNNFAVSQTSDGGKVCGQIAGYPCTHNITIAALTRNNCLVKTPLNQVRPDHLNCEPDAGCETLLLPKRLCPVTKVCKCICATGHKCSGTHNTLHLSMNIQVFILALNLTRSFLSIIF